MRLSKPLIAALAAGTLTVGGAGAWLALPSGTTAAAPSVQLSSTNAGLDVATSPTSASTACETESWPASATGKPAGDVAGGAKGFYLWHDANGWHLEVTHATD